MNDIIKNLKILLNPIGIIVLLGLLILPVIVAINLTAKTRTIYQVLGTEDSRIVNVELIEGEHRIIREEDFEDRQYTCVLKSREAGQYSKPILEVENKTDKEAQISMYGRVQDSSPIVLGVISETVEDNKGESIKYILSDSQDSEYVNKFELAPGDKRILYLDIKSEVDVSYLQEVVINFDINVSK